MVGVLIDGARNAGVRDIVDGVDPTDADGPVYTLAEKHRAVQGILERFIRRTKCTRVATTLALVLNSGTVDTSGVTLFEPSRIVSPGIYIAQDSNYSDADVGCGLTVVSYAEILRERGRCGTTSGVPRFISFPIAFQPQTATVWPPAKAAGSVIVNWYSRLTSFTAGTQGITSTAINLPGDIAADVVRTGGVCWLQNSQIENVPLTNPLWAAYLELEQNYMGAVNTGERSLQREPVPLSGSLYSRW